MTVITGPQDFSFCEGGQCSLCAKNLTYPFLEFFGRRNSCAFAICWACGQKFGHGLKADLDRLRALPSPSLAIKIFAVSRVYTANDEDMIK